MLAHMNFVAPASRCFSSCQDGFAGPSNITVGSSLVVIPANQAAVVMFRFKLDGTMDKSDVPQLISAASSNKVLLTLDSLVKTSDAVYVGCTYIGQVGIFGFQ